MSRIVILTQSPFSKRDYDRFGVALLSKNFQVSVLDCTPWLKPDFWTKYSSIAFSCPGYVAVENFKMLRDHLVGCEDAVAIDFLGKCFKSSRIRRELKNRKISMAIVHNGLLPEPAVKLSKRIKRIVNSNTTRALFKKILWQAKQKLCPEPAPDIVLLSGESGLKDERACNAEHRIWAHSFDYDVYLENNTAQPAIVAPYAVFLDEDVVHHSDYDHMGIRPYATEQSYYASMNSFFKKLEQDLKMPVIVAAHPRSNYDLRSQLWEGRTAIKGRTAQLVRDAALVLVHASTAVSYAVLWRKPLLFLTTDEVLCGHLNAHIVLTSTLLKAPIFNVDDDGVQFCALKSCINVDGAAYAGYIKEYIKQNGTPDKPLWQIFSDYVQCEL